MDHVNSNRRSEIMRKIHGKNTAPELQVRKLVFSLGYRYRLHNKLLPGTPDLVFAGKKKIIFVHGCFWHLHPNCPKARIPKSRIEYWEPKLEENRKRDEKALAQLDALGWKVLVIWQCELRNLEHLEKKIVEFLG